MNALWWHKRLLIVVFILDLVLQIFFRSRGVGVFNQGISFGIMSWINPTIFALIFVLFIIWVWWDLRKGRKELSTWIMILGGLGNTLPRIWWGGVWDYINLPFIPFSFNLSDVMISIGVLSYILGDDGN